jgi:hypothetical protein
MPEGTHATEQACLSLYGGGKQGSQLMEAGKAGRMQFGLMGERRGNLTEADTQAVEKPPDAYQDRCH